MSKIAYISYASSVSEGGFYRREATMGETYRLLILKLTNVLMNWRNFFFVGIFAYGYKGSKGTNS